MLRRIVCAILATTFIFSETAFGLSPWNVSDSPGSDTREEMYAAGQKLLAAKNGPGALNTDIAVGMFTGTVPHMPNLRIVPAENNALPEGWSLNPLLEEKNIARAFSYFLKNEAKLPISNYRVSEGYFEPERADEGEIPICRWERDPATNVWTLVLHTDFVNMWNDLRKNDVWFEYTFPDGEKRTASLAWAVFYRIAKHEVSDLERASGKPKSFGHFTASEDRSGRGIEVSKLGSDKELIANMTGGRYALVNDAVWMWFLGSYCFGKPTQYNNDTLKDRLLWFLGLYRGKNDAELNRWATEHNLPDEFPNLHDGEKRDEAVKIAQVINHAFFSSKKADHANTLYSPGVRKSNMEQVIDMMADGIDTSEAANPGLKLKEMKERLEDYILRAVAYAILHRGIMPNHPGHLSASSVITKRIRDPYMELNKETDDALRMFAIKVVGQALNEKGTKIHDYIEISKRGFSEAAALVRDYIKHTGSGKRQLEGIAHDVIRRSFGVDELPDAPELLFFATQRLNRRDLVSGYESRAPNIEEVIPATGVGGGLLKTVATGKGIDVIALCRQGPKGLKAILDIAMRAYSDMESSPVGTTNHSIALQKIAKLRAELKSPNPVVAAFFVQEMPAKLRELLSTKSPAGAAAPAQKPSAPSSQTTLPQTQQPNGINNVDTAILHVMAILHRGGFEVTIGSDARRNMRAAVREFNGKRVDGRKAVEMFAAGLGEGVPAAVRDRIKDGYIINMSARLLAAASIGADHRLSKDEIDALIQYLGDRSKPAPHLEGNILPEALALYESLAKPQVAGPPADDGPAAKPEAADMSYVSASTPDYSSLMINLRVYDAETPPAQKRALVTGGAGYVGSVLTRYLMEQGVSVWVIDDESTGHSQAVPEEIKAAGRYLKGDVTDAELVRRIIEDNGIDTVYHLAAKTLMGDSVETPALYNFTNVGGTLAVAEAIKKAQENTGRRVTLLNTSTCGVYDDEAAELKQGRGLSEKSSVRPTAPYTETKLLGEQVLGNYQRDFGVEYVSIRPFNIVGAYRTEDGLWWGEDTGHATHLITVAGNVIMGRQPALTIFGNEWNTQSISDEAKLSPERLAAFGITADRTPIREYIHVLDICKLCFGYVNYLKGCLSRAEPVTDRVLSGGTGVPFSALKVVGDHLFPKAIELGIRADFPATKIGSPRDGDDAVKTLEPGLQEALLGIKAGITMDEIAYSHLMFITTRQRGYEDDKSHYRDIGEREALQRLMRALYSADNLDEGIKTEIKFRVMTDLVVAAITCNKDMSAEALKTRKDRRKSLQVARGNVLRDEPLEKAVNNPVLVNEFAKAVDMAVNKDLLYLALVASTTLDLPAYRSILERKTMKSVSSVPYTDIFGEDASWPAVRKGHEYMGGTCMGPGIARQCMDSGNVAQVIVDGLMRDWSEWHRPVTGEADVVINALGEGRFNEKASMVSRHIKRGALLAHKAYRSAPAEMRAYLAARYGLKEVEESTKEPAGGRIIDGIVIGTKGGMLTSAPAGTDAKPEAASLEVTDESSGYAPFVRIIGEYFAKAARDKGPGRTEPNPIEIAEFYPIHEAIKAGSVEVYLPQILNNAIDGSVKSEIAALNKRIRERTGRQDDAVTLRPYDGRNLEAKLAQKRQDVRRIFVNDMTMTADIRNMAAERATAFTGNRLITVSVPSGRNAQETAVNQAWLVKVALLSAMVEDDTISTVGAALRDELEGRIPVSASEFISNLTRAENDLTPVSSVATRINYFLGAIVKLSQFAGEQIRILKAFWTAA